MIPKFKKATQGILLPSPLPSFYDCEVFFSQIAHTVSYVPFSLISHAKIFQGSFFPGNLPNLRRDKKRNNKILLNFAQVEELENQTETANFRKIQISKIDHRENKQLEQNNYRGRILTFEKQCQKAPARKVKVNAFHRLSLHNV